MLLASILKLANIVLVTRPCIAFDVFHEIFFIQGDVGCFHSHSDAINCENYNFELILSEISKKIYLILTSPTVGYPRRQEHSMHDERPIF